MTPRAARHLSCPPRQQGFVLVTGLLFLVIMTLLGLAMFRGTGLMDRISSNTRDKQRSFEAAQSALQYGEWWLGTGNGGLGSACSSGLVSGDTVSNIHTCSNALASGYESTVPFPNAFTYTPPNLKVSLAGGLVSTTAGSDVNYQTLPGFYVESLGLAPDGVSQVYQVTAYGTGGSANTVSVVRSTYEVTPAVHSLTGL
jgi:type IV pilus assembly protein PilX